MSKNTASSGRNAANTPNPITVSVPEFVRCVFREHAGNAWLAADCDQNGGTDGWFGFRAGNVNLNKIVWGEGDHYYSVGAIKPEARGKGDHNWLCAPVIVVDDVTEKAPADKVRAALGEPSYILQSSPKSQQWGYLLRDALTDAAVQARIMKALTLGLFGGKDPGHGNLTRYVRLPAGVNSKPARVAENDGTPPAVQLVAWEPSRMFDVAHFERALSGIPGIGGKDAWTEAEGARPGNSSVITAADMPKTLEEARAKYPHDYFLAAFDKLGMVKGLQGSIGYVEIECPFERIGDTTHAKKDDRTAWNPAVFARGGNGFKCHHTDAGCDPSNAGIEAVLRRLFDQTGLSAAEFDRLKADMRAERIADVFGKVDGSENEAPPTPFDPAIDGINAAAARAATGKAGFISIGKGMPDTPGELSPDICSLVTRGQMTVGAAAGGAGKSLLSMLLSLAIASDPSTEPHKLIGDREPFDFTGDVIIAQNEDAPGDTINRRSAAIRLHRIDPNKMRHQVFINETPMRAIVRDDKFSAPRLAEELRPYTQHIRNIRAAEGDVCMLVIDTQRSAFDGIEENDNGAMGRAYTLLNAWAREMDVAVLLMHHTTKGANKEGRFDQTAISGAGAITTSVRRAFVLTNVDPEDTDDGIRRACLHFVKGNHDDPAASKPRYFKFMSENVGVVHPRAPGILRSKSYPALMFDPIGPRVAPTEDILLNACSLVIEAEDGRAPLYAAEGGNSPRRAVKVLADRAGGKHKGAVIVADLIKRGWIEKGKIKSNNHMLDVWLATDAGRAAVEARANAADASGFAPIEDDTPERAETDNVVTLQPKATRKPRKPKAKPAPALAAATDDAEPAPAQADDDPFAAEWAALDAMNEGAAA